MKVCCQRKALNLSNNFSVRNPIIRQTKDVPVFILTAIQRRSLTFNDRDFHLHVLTKVANAIQVKHQQQVKQNQQQTQEQVLFRLTIFVISFKPTCT